MDVGVLVGCDAKQEWLLSWWYSHFRKHNPACNIAFADFGMSEEARNWCKDKGTLIPVPMISTGPLIDGFPYLGKKWEMYIFDKSAWPPVSDRKYWFLKPAAIGLSPFHRTLWIDLDCKIRGNLNPLLSFPLPSAKVAMRPIFRFYLHNISSKEMYFIKGHNSGVVLIEKDCPFLNPWMEAAKNGAVHHFYADDLLLSSILAIHGITNATLPLKYNWNASGWGYNPEALIDHWEGERGKIAIRILEMNLPV